MTFYSRLADKLHKAKADISTGDLMANGGMLQPEEVRKKMSVKANGDVHYDGNKIGSVSKATDGDGKTVGWVAHHEPTGVKTVTDTQASAVNQMAGVHSGHLASQEKPSYVPPVVGGTDGVKATYVQRNSYDGGYHMGDTTVHTPEDTHEAAKAHLEGNYKNLKVLSTEKSGSIRHY